MVDRLEKLLLRAGCMLLLLFGASSVLGHGASRGLHLHLSPDPAARGEKVTIELSAAEDVEHVRLAFVGQRPVEKSLDPPLRHFELKLVVPEDAGGETINCHAEARTTGGKTLRASAVLRIANPLPAPSEEP